MLVWVVLSMAELRKQQTSTCTKEKNPWQVGMVTAGCSSYQEANEGVEEGRRAVSATVWVTTIALMISMLFRNDGEGNTTQDC